MFDNNDGYLMIFDDQTSMMIYDNENATDKLPKEKMQRQLHLVPKVGMLKR